MDTQMGGWQAIEFVLAILGALFLLDIFYKVYLEGRIEKGKKEEADKISDKYFNNENTKSKEKLLPIKYTEEERKEMKERANIFVKAMRKIK